MLHRLALRRDVGLKCLVRLVLAIGICAIFGQLLLTLALKVEEAGVVALMRTIDIVLAFLLQATFLATPIRWTSVLGALIVCVGVAAGALRKHFTHETEATPPSTDNPQPVAAIAAPAGEVITATPLVEEKEKDSKPETSQA